MTDQSTPTRAFSVPFQTKTYDFVVTNASDHQALVLNVARAAGKERAQFGRGLMIDRHTGNFDFDDPLQEDIYAQRPVLMKLNAIPAKILGFFWKIIMGLLGSRSPGIALGTSSVAMGWNLGVLVMFAFIITLAVTMGVYIILPLLVISILCFLIENFIFQKSFDSETKDFMRQIADNVEDLVEETVVY